MADSRSRSNAGRSTSEAVGQRRRDQRRGAVTGHRRGDEAASTEDRVVGAARHGSVERRSQSSSQSSSRGRDTDGVRIRGEDADRTGSRVPVTGIDEFRALLLERGSGSTGDEGTAAAAVVSIPAGSGRGISSAGRTTLFTDETLAGGSSSVAATAAAAAAAADDCVRWSCHLHKSSSSCEVALCKLTGDMYHIVSVKETTMYAQRTFNARTENDEFWERLSRKHWYSPLAYCNMGNDHRVFESALRILRALDDRSLVYHQYNGPHDFVKRHLIVDGLTSVALCNKHLIKKVKRKQPQVKYTGEAWVKGFLKALFPGATGSRRIPTSTPSWAIELLTRKGALFELGVRPVTVSGRSLVDDPETGRVVGAERGFVVVAPQNEANVAAAEPATGLRFVQR